MHEPGGQALMPKRGTPTTPGSGDCRRGEVGREAHPVTRKRAGKPRSAFAPDPYGRTQPAIYGGDAPTGERL